MASLAVSTMTFSDWDYNYMYRNLYGSLHKSDFAKSKIQNFGVMHGITMVLTFFNQFAFSQQLSAGYMKIY